MKHISVTVRVRDLSICLDAALNYPARVDTLRHQNHVSSSYRSDFSSKIKL